MTTNTDYMSGVNDESVLPVEDSEMRMDSAEED